MHADTNSSLRRITHRQDFACRRLDVKRVKQRRHHGHARAAGLNCLPCSQHFAFDGQNHAVAPAATAAGLECVPACHAFTALERGSPALTAVMPPIATTGMSTARQIALRVSRLIVSVCFVLVGNTAVAHLVS
jgi:hypothetical protein